MIETNAIVTLMVTKDDIYEIGKTNHIVAQCINMHEHSGLEWSACLAIMVSLLSKQNKKYLDVLMEQSKIISMPTPVIKEY